MGEGPHNVPFLSRYTFNEAVGASDRVFPTEFSLRIRNALLLFRVQRLRALGQMLTVVFEGVRSGCALRTELLGPDVCSLRYRRVAAPIALQVLSPHGRRSYAFRLPP